MRLTAPEKLKQKLIKLAINDTITESEKILAQFRVLEEEEQPLADIESEFRSGEYVTNLEAPYSRHYESRSVAAQMLDGSYVGWTYWYGGGKHGEPEAIDWIEEAYDVEMTEVVKVVKEFKRK